MSNINGAFQRYNARRSPAWRWERVLQLTNSADRPHGCSHTDDKFIEQARSFYLTYTEHPDQRNDLFLKNPGLYYAYLYHEEAEQDATLTLTIQSRILTRQPLHDIAQLLDTLPDAIRWYSLLFFDVVPHLGKKDWINLNVIMPAMERNMGNIGESFKKTVGKFPFVDRNIAKPFMDASLKLFAYFGGAVVLEYMMYGAKQGKQIASEDDLDRFFDVHFATAARSRSAQAVRTFEINKYNVMELFQVHANIIALEKGTDGKSAQQTVIERHVSGMLDELPWTVGRKERGDKFRDTEVEKFETGNAAELRDEEIMFASARMPLPQGLTDAMQIKIPAPRKQQQGKDQPKKK